MKNLGSLILGLIIGALVMYFYCHKSLALDTADDNGAPTKPAGLISPREGTTLDTAFNSRHTLISDSIVKRPDNRSSWWSLTDINEYLEYARWQTDSLGYQMNGIRVYLGAYPTTIVDSTTTVGYTTMFIAPTYSTSNPKGGAAAYRKYGDVPEASLLNHSTGGNPPDANYPQ